MESDVIAREVAIQLCVGSGSGCASLGLRGRRHNLQAVGNLAVVRHAATHLLDQRAFGGCAIGLRDLILCLFKIGFAIEDRVFAGKHLDLDLAFPALFILIAGNIGQRVIARTVIDSLGDLLLDIVPVISLSARFLSPCLGIGVSEHAFGHAIDVISSARIDIHAVRIEGIDRYPRLGELIPGFAIPLEVHATLAGIRELAGKPEQILSPRDARKIVRHDFESAHRGGKVIRAPLHSDPKLQ